ncbi:RNA polymerase recycling motor HelD [Staphylospora marina]|uniref:RNA polymerase recycling motor HelD n=1 Tax=Staphylospora marina TaxID=2490858 RepID=UPI000F5B9D7D|nr:RNA polymerase recycling motor HelD [Staphylospora marina]
MSVTREEWEKEQQRVDEVTRKIGERMAELERRAGGLKEEIVDIRRHFWDDVTVNLEDPDDALETAASIKQQAEVLAERERGFRSADKERNVLSRMKRSPWFGRIDFRESGETETERIYLGISSFRDEETDEFLVYDWRAPISSLYYDAAPGPVSFTTPGGTVSGELKLKRQYVIRSGKIVSLFDTGVTIGDELLQEVLGRQSDVRMKNIVSTIQKEQNRIIRSERARLLIVQGAAGSGKTSTALQRVAWLLYRYRGSLTADQIVLFSPNPMFNAYISTVLPELGEENTKQLTFRELLEQRLGDKYRLEDPLAQMEEVLTSDGEKNKTRIAAIRYKASPAFMKLLDRYLEELGREGLVFRDVRFREESIVTAAEILKQFRVTAPETRLENRIRQLAEWILAKLDERAEEEKKKDWVDEEIQYLDAETYLKGDRRLRSQEKSAGRDGYLRQRDVLADIVVSRAMKPVRRQVRNLRFVDTLKVYRRLFESPRRAARLTDGGELPEHWADICRETLKRLDNRFLSAEDATPFLYLTERIEGTEIDNTIRHVLIDEAQDYSPFQFAFIRRLYPRARITVLGDFNQAIFAHSAEQDIFAALPRLFNEDSVETFVLSKSYRSTRPIVEFTRKLIPDGENIEPFNREGAKPKLTVLKERSSLPDLVAGRIRELLAAGHGTVAVICKTARECHEACEALRERIPVKRITAETASFDKGALVIPSYLAKGIEFDAVIVWDASRKAYGEERDRKLFYTTCTRAMHELHLFCPGEPNPFVKGVPRDLVDVEEVGGSVKELPAQS